MFDFNRFFLPEFQTSQIIEREPVTAGDIDGVDYVEGSVGLPKTISIVSEDNVEKRNENINIKRNTFVYKYENPELPTFATSIEQLQSNEVK